MAGTVEGGLKARDKNLKISKDFYKEIGSLGGRKTGVKKGFAANPALAREAGKRGGANSKRRAVHPYGVYSKATERLIKACDTLEQAQAYVKERPYANIYIRQNK